MLRIQGRIEKWRHGEPLSSLPPELQELMLGLGYVWDDGEPESLSEVRTKAPEPEPDLLLMLDGPISQIGPAVLRLGAPEALERLIEAEGRGKARRGALKVLRTRLEVLYHGRN